MTVRYFTLPELAVAYPVLTQRLSRRLVAERRIPFSYAGRRVILREDDVVAYLDAGRVEPPRLRSLPAVTRQSAPKGAPSNLSFAATKRHTWEPQ